MTQTMLLLCYQYLQFQFFPSCSGFPLVYSTCHLWTLPPPLCWFRSLHSSSLWNGLPPSSGDLLLLQQVTPRSPTGIKMVFRKSGNGRNNRGLAKGRCAYRWLKHGNSSLCFSKSNQAYSKEDSMWTCGSKCVKPNKQHGFIENLVGHAKRI